MPRKNDPILASALRVLRVLEGWEQTKLALAADVSRSTIVRLEAGDQDLTRDRVEELAALMGVSKLRVAGTLAYLGTYGAAGSLDGPQGEEARIAIERTVAAAAVEVRSLLEERLRAAEHEALRSDAQRLWRQIEKESRADQRLFLQHGSEFQTWAMVERICDESERVAAHDAIEALELAELAQFAANSIPERRSAERERSHAYSLAFVGNALRVANRLIGKGSAEEAFERCKPFLLGGTEVADGFDNARVLDRAASLERDMGRYPEALGLLESALAVGAVRNRGRLLLAKGIALEQAGDAAEALRTLRLTSPLIDRESAPRLRVALLFSLTKVLLRLDRATEAEASFREVKALMANQGNSLDRIRGRALEGQILCATGEAEEGNRLLHQARKELAARGLLADAALVGLAQAECLLRAGAASAVRELASSLRPVLDEVGLDAQALTAVRLFLDAAKQEKATIALALAASACLRGLARV